MSHAYMYMHAHDMYVYTRIHACNSLGCKCTAINIALRFIGWFIAGSWTNIAVNSLNTKRTSSLEKSLSYKNIVRKMRPFVYQSRKNGSAKYFLLKKRC